MPAKSAKSLPKPKRRRGAVDDYRSIIKSMMPSKDAMLKYLLQQGVLRSSREDVRGLMQCVYVVLATEIARRSLVVATGKTIGSKDVRHALETMGIKHYSLDDTDLSNASFTKLSTRKAKRAGGKKKEESKQDEEEEHSAYEESSAEKPEAPAAEQDDASMSSGDEAPPPANLAS